MKKRFFLLLALTAALLLALGMSTALATEASPDDGHIHWAYCDNRGICAQCGAPYSGNIISHNWDGDYQYNETEHWKNCTVCGEELLRNNHSAMCDNPTVCSDCGVAYNGDDIRHYPNYEYNETEHWCICANCGEELYRGGHWAYCNDPTVCAYCGGPYSGDDIRHIWYDYQFNETEHWQVCTLCGEKGRQSEHWAWCDNPTVCAECGQPYSGSNVEHDWSEYQHNETEHWTYCNRCGEEINRSGHVAECDHPGVCYYCGASFSGDAVFHVADDWQYNETEHWLICTLCGEERERDEHWAKCDNPGVCAQCGAPYSGDLIGHYWSDYQYNDTEHWQYCTLCGEILEQGEHVAACNAPNVCAVCGGPYSGDNIEHDWGEYQYTETEHWVYCNRCGEELDRGEHGAWCSDPSVCAWCGASYSGDNIIHDWSDWKSDGTFHWKECTLCGTITDKEGHYVSCNNQNNQCRVCGAACENPLVRHNWDGYTHDDLYHWYECLNCGKALARNAHYAYCDAPGVCAECGYEKAGIPIYHDQDTSNFTIDKNYHTSECLRCGLKYIEQHYVYCTNPGICVVCGAAVSGITAQHTYADYEFDANYHWYTCTKCGLEQKQEHSRICTGDNTCRFCGQPYSGDNVDHYYDETVGFQYQHDETNHWYLCSECGEKAEITAHTFGDDGVCTVCEYSKPAVTDAPTAAPTEAPTEVPTTAPTDAPTATPTDAPTEQPTDAPTDTPHEHEWTVTAKTPATCKNEGVIAYSCACGETKLETVKPLGHNFVDFVSQGDGTHRSDCTRCGTFTVKSCQMQSRTVLGVLCEVCDVCGYVHIPELDGITLPEAPMADVTAVTATGEAASVQVFDVTAALPEGYAFVLCLRIVPEDGAALPGDVRITVPCTVDTANLRLIFIADGELPEEVPFEVIDGMITFTAAAPGVFALVPIQE